MVIKKTTNTILENFIFYISFRFTAKWMYRVGTAMAKGYSSSTLCPHIIASSSGNNIHPSPRGHLLKLMNSHLTHHNLKLTLGPTLSIVHSLSLDKWILTYHHHFYMQSIFIKFFLTIKHLYVHLFMPCLLLLTATHGNLQSLSCLHNFAFQNAT